MESIVMLEATREQIKEISYDRDTEFIIKNVEMIEEGQKNNKYEVLVRHHDEI